MHPPYRFNIHSPIQHGSQTFSIVSFNILSQTCLELHRQDRYTGDPEYHTWRHRLQRIVSLLATMMPSIICLQEVDLDPIIMRDLEKQFAQHGYAIVFQDPKKSSHMPFFVTAVLFRAKEFDLVWHESRSRALLVQLCWRDQSRNIYIGNMHLQANPDKADIRLHQARKALHRLENHIAESELDIEACPVILCGDFNDDDDSNVADFLHGKLEDPHQFIFEDVEHFMCRFSPTQADKTTLPSYFSKSASYELDFIFYSRTNLIPMAALRALEGESDLQKMESNPPPNAVWPSDHVPVGCVFSVQTNDIIIQNHR